MSQYSLYSPSVLFGISTLFWWLILTPITIYYLLCYYQHRNDVAIRHRDCKLVLLFGLFCIFFWCVERPLEFIWKIEAFELDAYTLNILGQIHYVLFPLTIHGFIWCIVWRYYMIYFNIRFYEENINMKWKIIINYSMNSKTRNFNWFLVHKQSYGSLQWLTPRIIIVFLCVTFTLIFAQFYDQLIAAVLDGVLSFFAVPILLMLWYKTPMMDHFDISMEYVYIIILCLIEWCFYFGGTLLNTIVFTNGKKSTLYIDELTFLLIESWTGVLFAFCILIICTKWTLSKREETQRHHKATHSSTTSLRSLPSRSIAHVQSTSSLSVKQQPNILRKSIISPRGRQLKLFECLQCDHGFNCFMNHLMREFSHECLLSTLEFIQFKKGLSYAYTDMLGATQLDVPLNHIRSIEIHHKLDDSSSSEETPSLSPIVPPLLLTTTSVLSTASASECSSTRFHNNAKREMLTCQFPDCVPQSFIVYKSSDSGLLDKCATNKKEVLQEYKLKARQLFEKYIYNAHKQCTYEININYNMRKRLINLMKNKDEWIHNPANDVSYDELYTLFDDCILEMYDLMCHSFVRFKKTAEFAKLDRKIFCKASFPDAFIG